MKRVIFAVFLTTSFTATQVFAQKEITKVDANDNLSTGAFFEKQAEERDAFLKAHPDLIGLHDRIFSEKLALDRARAAGKSTAGMRQPETESSELSDFLAKQKAEKDAFLAKHH